MNIGTRLLRLLLLPIMLIGILPLAQVAAAQVIDDTPHITAISPNPGLGTLGSSFTASFNMSYGGTAAGYVMVFVGPATGNYFGPRITTPQCIAVNGMASYYPPLTFAIPSPIGAPQNVNYRVWAWFQPTTICPFMASFQPEKIDYLDYGVAWNSPPAGLSASGRVADTSGQAIEGVTMTISPGTPTTTDAGGNFTFWGLTAGGSYSFTPSKAGYTFSPASIGLSIANSITNLNFTGTAAALANYSIAGTIHDRCGVPIPDVTVSAGGAGSATTDATGSYQISNLSAGSYTLTPSKSGYSFDPPALGVSGPPDATGKDFIAEGNPNGAALAVTPSSIAADGKTEARVILSGAPAGHNLRILSNRNKIDIFNPAGGSADSNGCFATNVRSSAIGQAILSAQDLTLGIDLAPQVQIDFTGDGLRSNGANIEVKANFSLNGRYLEGLALNNHISIKPTWKGQPGTVIIRLNGVEIANLASPGPDGTYGYDLNMGTVLKPGSNVLEVIARAQRIDTISQVSTPWSWPTPIWLVALQQAGLAGALSLVLDGDSGVEATLRLPKQPFEALIDFGITGKKNRVGLQAVYAEGRLKVPFLIGGNHKGALQLDTTGAFKWDKAELKIAGGAFAEPYWKTTWPFVAIDYADLGINVEGKLNIYQASILATLADFAPGVGTSVKAFAVGLGVESYLQRYGYVYVDLKLNIGGGGRLAFDPDTHFQSVYAKGGLGIEGGVRIYITPVELHAYLGADGDISWSSNPSRIDHAAISGQIGAEAIVFGFKRTFEGKIAWSYDDPNTQAASVQQINVAKSALVIPDPSKALSEGPWTPVGHPAAHDYARFQGGTGNQSLSTLSTTALQTLAAPSVLVSNVYTYTQSALAANPVTNDALLVWVHDNINKPVGQAHEIFFSRWNGTTWSTPAGITNDNLLDGAPQVAWAADGRAVAIWQRLNTPLRNNATATAKTFKKIEIATATYDPANNTWSPVTLLTNNSALDMQPQLVRGNDGRIMAVWRQNRTGVLSGDAANPDQIVIAFYDNGWSKPVAAVKDITGLVDLAAGYGNGTATIAFTRFVQSGGSSQPALQLFSSTWDGKKWSKPVQRSRDKLDYRNPQVIYNAANQPLVSALVGTDLRLLNLTTGVLASQTLPPEIGGVDEFRLVQDHAGNIAAVFAAQAGQRDLYMAFYDQAHNLWGLPTRLTNDRASEGYLAPAIDNTDRLVMGYAATAINTEIHTAVSSSGTISYTMPVEGQTDLIVLAHTFGQNISLTDLHISDEHPVPGATVVLSTTLRNSGDLALDNSVVSFYDGDPYAGGVLIGSTHWPTPLVAGATTTLTTTYTVPTTGGARMLYAVADPARAIAESDENDNVASHAAFGPDLEIVDAKVDYWGDRNVGLITQIRNRGTVTSPAATLRFFHDAITGTLALGNSVPALQAGQTITITTPWNYDALAAGTYRLVANVNQSDFPELFSANNTRELTLDNRPDLMVSSAYLWTTPRTDPTVAITTTIFNTGPVEAHDVIIGFYRDERMDYRSLVFTRTLTVVPAGGAIQVSGIASGPMSCGVYVAVDPDQHLNEVSREDNLAAITGAPLLRRIYGVSETHDRDSQLFALDPLSHTLTLIGGILAGYDIEGIAAHPATDVLYAASNRNGVSPGMLYTIDKQSGALAVIGSTGFKGTSDLAFRPIDGTLWGWVEGTGLIQIDITTGRGTLAYESSQSVEAMSWSWDGTQLYVGTGKRLLAYDPNSRTITNLANNLPRDPEALIMRPDGVLLGSADGDHRNIFAYAISELQPIDSQKIAIPFDDVEALTWSESCSQ